MSAYYWLVTYDERDNNWVTMQENLYGANSIFQSCIPYFCRACHRINQEAVFESKEGFEAGPQIRVKTGREFAHSGEGFTLIRTRVLKLLKRHRVTGYAARPIPSTDWHVLRITRTVPFKKFKPRYDEPGCKLCGYRAYYGIADALRQIAVPAEDNTFFTPKFERPQGQDIYLTEQVALMLKANRAKGAALDRLLDDDEYKLACADTPAAQRKIKHRSICL
jgi:hypothetical protein